MNTNTPRKKQPEHVRSQLLTAAAHVAVEKGLAALTLDAVARRAGVSKGGLLHHFPNKQHLLESLFKDMLERLDTSIAACLVGDSEPRGRFTRAYIHAVTELEDDCFESRLRGVATLSMCADPSLAALWHDWVQRHMEQRETQDCSVLARILRYTADGIWLEDITKPQISARDTRNAAIAHLIKQTYTL